MRFCGAVLTIFCKLSRFPQRFSTPKTGGACDVFYLFVTLRMDQPAGDDALFRKFNGRNDLVTDGAPSRIYKSEGCLLKRI